MTRRSAAPAAGFETFDFEPHRTLCFASSLTLCLLHHVLTEHIANAMCQVGLLRAQSLGRMNNEDFHQQAQRLVQIERRLHSSKRCVFPFFFLSKQEMEKEARAIRETFREH